MNVSWLNVIKLIQQFALSTLGESSDIWPQCEKESDNGKGKPIMLLGKVKFYIPNCTGNMYLKLCVKRLWHSLRVFCINLCCSFHHSWCNYTVHSRAQSDIEKYHKGTTKSIISQPGRFCFLQQVSDAGRDCRGWRWQEAGWIKAQLSSSFSVTHI